MEVMEMVMPGRPQPVSNVLPSTVTHDPGKYADRVNAAEWATLGQEDAPEGFAEDVRRVWDQLHADFPQGYFKLSDRYPLAKLCRLIAKELAGTITSKQEDRLLTLFGKFGMMPADRSRVPVPPSPQLKLNDEWSEFTN
jgi:hypothetical protein